jgi:hypothetical protein
MQGRQAAVFVNDMTTPAMLVPNMARDPRPGYIAVGGFVPPGSPGEGPAARFADVTIRPDVGAFDFKAALVKTAGGIGGTDRRDHPELAGITVVRREGGRGAGDPGA